MTELTIRDYLRETNIIHSRLAVALVLMGIGIVLLVGRLIYLQVVNYDHYATLSLNNRIQLVPVPAVRGMIYDRNGVVLAQNFPIYNLEITPDQVEDMDATLDELGRVVQITDDDVTRFTRSTLRRPGFEPQVLRFNLSDAEAARFSINQYRFPGAQLQARLQRYYPHGLLTSHVVGYVGRISEQDLMHIDRSAYRGSDYIGKLGIEAHYESTLLGQVGFEQVETNAHGRVVRLLSRTAPVAGRNLHLGLDIRLQKAAYEALGEHRGAVVAIEPATGSVLAFVSKPAYNPNPFVNGIDAHSYGALRLSTDRPLLNRALHGRYAPGSTIKPFMAMVQLHTGADPGRTYCPGWYKLPGRSRIYRDWKKGGHGNIGLRDAIIQSCDVYFYRLAKHLGIDRMQRELARFGLGRATGIDLDGEPTGLVPSSEWKRRVRGAPWYPGETISAGIGQGYMLVTPLQLATVTATLANRGQRMRPRFVESLQRASQLIEPVPPTVIDTVTATHPDDYARIIDAMVGVVHGKRGTARAIGKDARYTIAGKTGTAQVIGMAAGQEYDEDKVPEKFRDHALFIAFAPADDPQIAVAVVAENGGGGSRTAAPIARRVMDYYLVERHFDLGNAVVKQSQEPQRRVHRGPGRGSGVAPGWL
ncbi:MAG: penicillin-binding protein 2 [Gammaproteobacteria bacterium]|nr:penicillin-binding protein 2 [Gammaproteobacteria bacterium]